MARRMWSAWLVLALSAGSPASAAPGRPRLVASFTDDADDDTGPGTYSYPGDTGFTPGDFDLRRFAVYADGDDVLFEVTLGASFREPDIAQRTNRIPLQLLNGIYLQNVDIYVDTDPASPAGFSACIPGRRVAFADGRTWKAAVVLTPQPSAARTVVASALGPEAAARVAFADGLEVRGRTVTARVPNALFGGPPRPEWGYSVHVSGARWERTFSALDLIKGSTEADAFTMPVVGMREAWAFGGAPSGQAHPRVVDVLLPPGTDQKEVLGSFVVSTGTFAAVPFVYAVPAPPPVARPASPPPPAPAAPVAAPTPVSAPAGPGRGPEQGAPAAVAPPVPALPGGTEAAAGAPAAVAAKAAPRLEVADLSGDLVTISGPVAGIRPMQIGEVLGPGGAPVARLVVVQVFEGGLVASAVEGRSKILRGALVRFDGAPP